MATSIFQKIFVLVCLGLAAGCVNPTGDLNEAGQALSGPALVQKASVTSSGASSLTAAYGSSVHAGDLLVVAVSSWPAAPASTAVSDSAGDTFKAVAPAESTSEGTYVALFYAQARSEGADTVTFTTGQGQLSMVVAELSGVTATALDAAAASRGTGKALSSTNMTPTGSGDLILGAQTHDATTVTTAGTGDTMVAVATEDDGSHAPLALEFGVGTGTTPVAATFAVSTSTTWAVTGALFRSAATGALTITTGASLPGGNVSIPYATTLAATGGKAPYTWAVTSGALPQGLTLAASGAISGTPSAAGSSTFTATVTDAAGAKVAQSFTIKIAHDVVLSWTASTTTGVTYNIYRATTSGGPYSELTSGLTKTTFTDKAVSAGSTFYYACTAVDAGGESAKSNLSTAVVPSP